MGTPGRAMNRLLVALLRSPLHPMVSGSLMVLTYRGRRSGHGFRTPMQYVLEGDTVTAFAGRPSRKVWWRNFVQPTPASLRIAGRERPGTGRVLTDPAEISDALRAYLRRFPRALGTLKVPVGPDGEPDLEALLGPEPQVLVRFRLDTP